MFGFIHITKTGGMNIKSNCKDMIYKIDENYQHR